MALSRTPSASSLIAHMQKAGTNVICKTLSTIFGTGIVPTGDESESGSSDDEDPQTLLPSTQTLDSYPQEPPQSVQLSPSQPSQVASPSNVTKDLPCSDEPVAGPSRIIDDAPEPEEPVKIATPKRRHPPIFIRDFAYRPKPPIKDYPVDEKWVVECSLPKNCVPGMRERHAKQWEESHAHLYREGGNRADPPHTIPKTWGGYSKEEDEKMMRKAEKRIRIARMRAQALGFGLTPTEPNLEDGARAPSPLSDEEDSQIAARIETYRQEMERKVVAAGYPPLEKTPPYNDQSYMFPESPLSPEPSRSLSRPGSPLLTASRLQAQRFNRNNIHPREARRLLPDGARLGLLPAPTVQPTEVRSGRSSSRRPASNPDRLSPKNHSHPPKRLRDEPAVAGEPDEGEVPKRARRRYTPANHHDTRDTLPAAEAGPSTPPRYALRQRAAGSPIKSPQSSPKNIKGKGKGKAT